LFAGHNGRYDQPTSLIIPGTRIAHLYGPLPRTGRVTNARNDLLGDHPYVKHLPALCGLTATAILADAT